MNVFRVLRDANETKPHQRWSSANSTAPDRDWLFYPNWPRHIFITSGGPAQSYLALMPNWQEIKRLCFPPLTLSSRWQKNAAWHHKSFKPNARPCISHAINQHHSQKWKGYLCSRMLDKLTFHVRFDRSACYLGLSSQYGNTTFNVRSNERTDKHPSLSGCLLATHPNPAQTSVINSVNIYHFINPLTLCLHKQWCKTSETCMYWNMKQKRTRTRQKKGT